MSDSQMPPPEPGRQLPEPASESPRAGLSYGDPAGRLLHAAAPPVVAELRYAVAKLHLQKGGVPARLGLTSAVSGEGVSYIARSLATVVAHDLQHNVCLVDLNWWTRAPAEEQGPGVAEIVNGHAGLGEALRRTDNPNLLLLPAGAVGTRERSRIARSEALHRLLDELAGRFDHVLVDLPAVLVASEAITLADNLERCLLVVQQGVTPVGMVRSALDHLNGIQVLGVVLNRAATPVPGPILRRLLFS